jgi:hypothetical protein
MQRRNLKRLRGGGIASIKWNDGRVGRSQGGVCVVGDRTWCRVWKLELLLAKNSAVAALSNSHRKPICSLSGEILTGAMTPLLSPVQPFLLRPAPSRSHGPARSVFKERQAYASEGPNPSRSLSLRCLSTAPARSQCLTSCEHGALGLRKPDRDGWAPILRDEFLSSSSSAFSLYSEGNAYVTAFDFSPFRWPHSDFGESFFLNNIIGGNALPARRVLGGFL